MPHLHAAVACKGHFQHSSHQAAVADVVPCRDLALSQQLLGSFPGSLESLWGHVWGLISHLHPTKAWLLPSSAINPDKRQAMWHRPH